MQLCSKILRNDFILLRQHNYRSWIYSPFIKATPQNYIVLSASHLSTVAPFNVTTTDTTHVLADVFAASPSDSGASTYEKAFLPLDASPSNAKPSLPAQSQNANQISGLVADHAAKKTSTCPSGRLRTFKNTYASRLSAQKRRKENKLLVNQVLKDKGQTSYDWRIPLRMLESHVSSLDDQYEGRDQALDAQTEKTTFENNKAPAPVQIKRVRFRARTDFTLARDVPKPNTQCDSSLVDYLEDVRSTQFTKDKVPRISSNDSKDESNTTYIIRIFEDVFRSDEWRNHLSAQAYNTALRFYYDHGLISKARRLFIQMENSDIHIPIETSNLVLRGAASSRDLHSFTFILQKLLQRGFKPNYETWRLLLMTITSDEVRAIVAQRMWERRVFYARPQQRNIMQMIVQNEMGRYVANHGDAEAIMDYMDKHYKGEWLATSTGNKLLCEFSKHHSVPETLDLLLKLKTRGFKADYVSLGTVLHHCLILKQHRNAIQILEFFDYQFGLQPEKLGHEILFSIAWKNHLLNFARIVWKHACIRGHATSKMRRLVVRSLLVRPAAHLPFSRATRFRKLLGKFVTRAIKPHEYNKPSSTPVLGVEVDRGNLSRVERFRALVCTDLCLARRVHLLQDFGSLLSKALDLDMIWAARNILRTATPKRILNDAIQMDYKILAPTKGSVAAAKRRVAKSPSNPSIIQQHTSGTLAQHAAMKSKTRIVGPKTRQHGAEWSFRKTQALFPRAVQVSPKTLSESEQVRFVGPKIRKYGAERSFRKLPVPVLRTAQICPKTLLESQQTRSDRPKQQKHRAQRSFRKIQMFAPRKAQVSPEIRKHTVKGSLRTVQMSPKIIPDSHETARLHASLDDVLSMEDAAGKVDPG
ncbi:hypothetical protein ACLMJK_000451 [Lecanora helva]